MKDVAPILRSLGLLESEVKVYLAALERGPSTVIDLAGATRLSRPATYTAIEALTERGLTSTVQRGKKRLFAAEHPDRLLRYAQRRETELKARVQDLEGMIAELALRAGGERPAVKVYEGKEGILAIIEDLKASRPKTIEELADVDAMMAILSSEDLAPLRQELRRINAKIRGLYAGAAQRSSIAEARVLPKELAGFSGNIEIYGDKVALVTYRGKLYSVIIENAVITRTMRALFDLAWERAREFPEPSA